MYIDSHVHLPFSQREDWKPLLENQLKHMDLIGIERTCLMPMCNYPGYIYPNPHDMRFQAEVLSEIDEAYQGKFFPMLLMNPLLDTSFNLELLTEYIVNGPLIGVKFHVSMLADDPRMNPIYEFLQQYDIPVLFHSWYKTVNKTTFESNPGHIAAAAAQYPKLRILMAHMTAGRLRGVQDIKPYPNVWVDTSGSQPENGYMQVALAELGSERILYGSDYPLRSFASQLGRIDSVEMNKEDRKRLLYRNALSFFRKGGAR